MIRAVWWKSSVTEAIETKVKPKILHELINWQEIDMNQWFSSPQHFNFGQRYFQVEKISGDWRSPSITHDLNITPSISADLSFFHNFITIDYKPHAIPKIDLSMASIAIFFDLYLRQWKYIRHRIEEKRRGEQVATKVDLTVLWTNLYYTYYYYLQLIL